MTGGRLQAVTTAFDDRNMVLGLTLGLVSLLRRFRALLRRHGVAAPGVPAPARDEFLLLVLGLVSFSHAAMSRRRLVGRARRRGRPADAPAAETPWPPRLLLR